MTIFVLVLLIIVLVIGINTDLLTHKLHDGFKVKLSEEERIEATNQFRAIVIFLLVMIVFALLYDTN